MTFRPRLLAALAALATATGTLAATAPASAAPARTVYVALGDSYTAGPLIPPQTDLATCARSGRNYPGLVSRALAVDTFRDVSCSSATTKHFREAQDPQVPGAPQAPPQYDALTRDTTLVTIGIGGNDIGLVGLATGCVEGAVTGQSCQEANGRSYERKIDRFAPTYGAVVDRVRKKAPHARILLVGYPTAIRDGGCYPYQPVLGQDATYLQSLIDRLNARMREQAEAHGAEYVDLRTSTIGHDACALPTDRWLEGLVPTRPAFPLHPNALGMKNASTQVLRTLSGTTG